MFADNGADPYEFADYLDAKYRGADSLYNTDGNGEDSHYRIDDLLTSLLFIGRIPTVPSSHPPETPSV